MYNQLTSSSSGNPQPEELTSGYPQLQDCGGFDLMKCIPNCKVLELIECQMSAKHQKTAAGQSKIYIRPRQWSYHSTIEVRSIIMFNFHTKGKMCTLF